MKSISNCIGCKYVTLTGLAWSILFLNIFCGLAQAGSSAHYIETFESGTINWYNGFLTATGEGRPPVDAVTASQAREAARRAATIVALRNLLTLSQNIRVDAERRVADLTPGPEIHSETQNGGSIRVSGFLQNYEILKTEFHSDNSATVTVGVSMRGTFSERILSVVTAPPAVFEPSAIPPGRSPDPPTDTSTQVIIDARGGTVSPAMLLSIRGVEGDIIAGPLVAGQDYVIQRMSKDAPDKLRLQAIQNPVLILPGTSDQTYPTDILLTPANARRLQILLEQADAGHLYRPLILLLD